MRVDYSTAKSRALCEKTVNGLDFETVTLKDWTAGRQDGLRGSRGRARR